MEQKRLSRVSWKNRIAKIAGSTVFALFIGALIQNFVQVQSNKNNAMLAFEARFTKNFAQLRTTAHLLDENCANPKDPQEMENLLHELQTNAAELVNDAFNLSYYFGETAAEVNRQFTTWFFHQKTFCQLNPSLGETLMDWEFKISTEIRKKLYQFWFFF